MAFVLEILLAICAIISYLLLQRTLLVLHRRIEDFQEVEADDNDAGPEPLPVEEAMLVSPSTHDQAIGYQ